MLLIFNRSVYLLYLSDSMELLISNRFAFQHWIFDYLALLISPTDLVICTKYLIILSYLFLQQISLLTPWVFYYNVLLISQQIWLAAPIFYYMVLFEQIIYTRYMIIYSCLPPTNVFISTKCLITLNYLCWQQIWLSAFSALLSRVAYFKQIGLSSQRIWLSLLAYLWDLIICFDYLIIWSC